MSNNFIAGFIVGVAVTFLAFVVLGVGFLIVRPWFMLKLAGGRGSLLQIVGMRLRGTPVSMIVEAYTALLHSGETLHLRDVESTYIAQRGKIINVQDLISHTRETLQQNEKGSKKGH